MKIKPKMNKNFRFLLTQINKQVSHKIKIFKNKSCPQMTKMNRALKIVLILFKKVQGTQMMKINRKSSQHIIRYSRK